MEFASHFTSQQQLQSEWRDRGCGVASMHMLLRLLAATDPLTPQPTLEKLLSDAQHVGAYIPNIGWSHAGLATLARTYGLVGFHRDNNDKSPTPLTDAAALKQLRSDLKHVPVIASVHKRFNPKLHGHIVVVLSCTEDTVTIADPMFRTATQGIYEIPVAKFLRGWKKRTIIVRTPNTFDTYLAMIQNSVGSRAFQDMWMRQATHKVNITKQGSVSCAFFVSTIMSSLRYIYAVHATVAGTIRDLEISGWTKVRSPKPGAILIWEEKIHPSGPHTHIGFYIDENTAISNDPTGDTPIRHHPTFGVKNDQPERKIVAIYWKPSINKN